MRRTALAPAAEGPAGRARRALLRIHRRLLEAYGEPSPRPRRPPLDELIFTILSQNTSDANRDRAWRRLRQRFPDWESVARARPAELAAAIAPGGLHRVKARRIRDLLRQVRRQRRSYDLDHLLGMEPGAVRQELARYKGVGPKSINCVLLFSLGRGAFPVDTHVHRVLRRVGLLASRELGRANRELEKEVPGEIAYPLHMNLIRHGRQVCIARRPRCRRCCLVGLCAYPDKGLGVP